MGRVSNVAFVVCCLGGLLVSLATADAVRTHSNFAASTYEEEPTKAIDPTVLPEVQVEGDEKTAAPSLVNTNNNETTDVQEDQPTTGENTENVTDRYPKGYYGNSQYTQQTEHVTPETTLSASLTAQDLENTTETTVIPDRYPGGYPKTVNDPAVYEQQPSNDAGGRYPNGYYSQSSYAGNTNTQSTSQVNPTSYTTSVQYSSDPQSFQGSGERYPYGYFPHSTYAGTMPSTTGTSYVGTSLSTQQNTDTVFDPNNRYPGGYYKYSSDSGETSTTTSTSTFQPLSYSSSLGNFFTMPSPYAGVPFDVTGAGCRTAYWVANVAKWPSFFTVTSTVSDAFGTKAEDIYGDITILQALLKYDSDGYSQLLRSGCTAILNSYTRGRYNIGHMKVVEEFNAALVSQTKAAEQAIVFETANVESISAGNACS